MIFPVCDITDRGTIHWAPRLKKGVRTPKTGSLGGLGGAYCFPLIAAVSFCLPVPAMLAWLVVLIKTVGYLRDIYLLI